MAVDVITGKPIQPRFEGQRTDVDIDFDPVEWQEQWNLPEGDVAGVEAGAIQSIKDALAQRYEGQDYWNVDEQGLRDYWAAENARNMGTPGYQEYVPSQAELANTGDVRLQDEASRIFREQIMGGYNPNIDYRAEGVTPNVFLRSGEGLGGWQPSNINLPQTSAYQALAPEAQAALNFQPETGFYAGGVPQISPATVTAPAPMTTAAPTAAPAAAPAASTQRATSVTQPAAAAAAAAEVDPAIAQREVVTKALAARLQPIQNALAAGIIDVTAAETAWNSARQEIYTDFLTEQMGIQTGFQTQADIDEAQRVTGRTKLLQDLNAAGVDSGMVADELALIDAITEASGDERMGLIGDIGRIGMMSDADRRMMGEGIFGGQRQALRTDARQMGLDAELLAAGQMQTADERALQAQALSPYMDVSPGALFADLYSDIDLTGMATGREQMTWGTGERVGGEQFISGESALDRALQTSERLGTQEFVTGERLGAEAWGTGERIGGQDWQSVERELDRDFTTGEREAVQVFTSDERVASQVWAHDERIESEDWTAAENLLGRTFTTDEREAIEDWNKGEREASERWTAAENVLGRDFTTDEREAIEAYGTLEREATQTWQEGESALDRVIDQQIADVSTQQLEESIRQFGAGQTAAGLDMRETIWTQTPQGLRQVPNPAYGRPLGFDVATGRTVGEQQQQEQFDVGQAFAERQFDELSAGDLANLTAQGIDQNETITQRNYVTGGWDTVANPNFGRPIGFDAATGLTAGERADEAYRDALLEIDQAATTQTQENWQNTYNQSKSEFDANLTANGIDPITGYVMGLDTNKFVDTGKGPVANPTYGMTPVEATNYTLAVQKATQGTGVELNEDWLLRELMYSMWGREDQAEMTNTVLKAVKDRIGSNENVMGGGMTPGNILWALGTLQADDTEFQPIYDAMLEKAFQDSYPNRPVSDDMTPGGGMDASAAAAMIPGNFEREEYPTAAAAAAAGTTVNVASPTYGTGAGDLSASEIQSQDLIDLIEEEQRREAAVGPPPPSTGGFEWNEGWTGTVGKFLAADQSYTTLTGTKYGKGSLNQINNSPIPRDNTGKKYTVPEYIDLQDERGMVWGMKADGSFGWKRGE